jgi:cytochrome c-type biogenesis protein CcmH
MTGRVWPWAALGVLVVAVVAILVWPNGAETRAERAHSIAAELKCLECQGLSVGDSSAPTSKAIRADIRRQIAAGRSDEEIRQSYVERYGEEILLQPQGSGISLIVWVLPVVVIAAGATGIWVTLSRNRREPRLHASASDALLVDRERGADDGEGGRA